MADELLVTKFFIPPQGSRNLPRERLFALLDRGLSPENHLTLVSAPAGYGKTALIADWVHRLAETPGAPAVAWLSLDESDNDPAVFFAYLAASLRTAHPAAADIAHRLLHAPQATPPRAAFAGLANELTQSGAGVVLVLDDYHLIRNPAIHDELAYWIDHLPPNAHLLVATRSDPSFPLHRYRGRGQMVEVRMDELRFSPEEVAGFMRQFSGVELGQAEVEILAGRTEGWIAGIQMAALSLRGKENKAQFIQSLAGSNRFILDYLAEEVIRDQPAEVKRFLLQSSILNRLCGPLCDALMGPEAGSESGQAMLERLESENLFLIPLDEERYWYRYHHLFADLLRLRLQQSARSEPGPGAVEQLHRRAAGWLAAAGWHAEAIQHFITAGDFEQAAELVERHTLRLFAQGELHRLLGWIRLLPPELAARRPRLSVYQAWTLAFAGRLGEVDAVLRPVEAA
ncbi:MAG TPA: AAA family ATPase, partial [Anaerolineaceae bacterium]|nr:AAA family ATPase [Anaerolineaceae bacterium]